MDSYKKAENLDKLKKHPLTATITDLSIGLIRKLVLYLEVLA